MNHPSKRGASANSDGNENRDDERRDGPAKKPTPTSLTHPISPPTKKRRLATPLQHTPPTEQSSAPSRPFKSPFHLTSIRDLPPDMNRDTVTLKDILDDPIIVECWEFNYLHDIAFLMRAFDQDVRDLVKVHVVHGFWKKEDPNRLALQEAASRYQNVTLHNAYLPEMFGTHHTKMMILLRNDDTAQIVIHTANMIVRDWRNMTQAVWRSPRLPLMRPTETASEEEPRIGSGAKFKIDFLNYLRAYGERTCKPIIDQLATYDFSSIRGSLIGSVPGRHNLNGTSPTRWGWAAMQQALQAVPLSPGRATIAVQISSIATLGPTDAWLRNTFFRALSGGNPPSANPPPTPPSFKVIFPTAPEIRASLDGYDSGASIHTKIQSPQQAKQLQYLRPMFCHWDNTAPGTTRTPASTSASASINPPQDAGRSRAAPHIKTYIRHTSPNTPTNNTIDWALLTSANLSKQAWGEAAATASTNPPTMRICSYELGVLVWPGLYEEGAVMKPAFLTDSLPEEGGQGGEKSAVALRMPYSLPLRGYQADEVPWVGTAEHFAPDWMGRVWSDG
ncbi:putative tyrosyl-DNA phosphodiesterase [Staphylotrichum tortipilum]|uniref:Tyrosyl-DNA phosphodiesterase n=1 Tax=Staphylotrichum tortipilum TaxID=2831512 RepID=A0AAN6RWP9_9PEZI|nr:putative tyrosyl-DNA phosphodiesterase [Staphylotrichum longicolle]